MKGLFLIELRLMIQCYLSHILILGIINPFKILKIFRNCKTLIHFLKNYKKTFLGQKNSIIVG